MRCTYTSILVGCLVVVASNTVTAGQSGSDGSKSGSKAGGAGQNALLPPGKSVPVIDLAASKNVTALLGKTAYLNCKVKNVGNRTVSWVRHRDIHLLTVGRYTYTSDQRFRAIHHLGTEDWTLQIKYPQHRDAGIYECQISTTPHMSHFVHLNVVEPTTEIIGGPDLYIDRGSTINLTCVVLFSPEPPAYIFWNHNDVIISYDSPRGGVSVITEKGETTTSFLLIQQAQPKDSGRYTCNPSNSQSKSINVHVLNDEGEIIDYSFPEGETSTATEDEVVDDFISTESTSESTTDFGSSESSTAYSTDSTTIESSSTIEPVMTTTSGPNYSTPQPSSGIRSCSLLPLSLIVGLVIQFPAAMQHGGQAHHRSSHLYCLIFCVCLLLFST